MEVQRGNSSSFFPLSPPSFPCVPSWDLIHWSAEPVIPPVGVGYCLWGDLPGCNESQAVSSWPSSPQPAALLGDSGLNFLHYTVPAHQPCWAGSHSPFSVTLSALPVKLDWGGPHCTFTLVSLLPEPWALVHLWALGSWWVWESHLSSSFKRVLPLAGVALHHQTLGQFSTSSTSFKNTKEGAKHPLYSWASKIPISWDCIDCAGHFSEDQQKIRSGGTSGWAQLPPTGLPSSIPSLLFILKIEPVFHWSFQENPWKLLD